jgi:hypothetical protein
MAVVRFDGSGKQGRGFFAGFGYKSSGAFPLSRNPITFSWSKNRRDIHGVILGNLITAAYCPVGLPSVIGMSTWPSTVLSRAVCKKDQYDISLWSLRRPFCVS